jgi:hypothetical protein
MPWFLNISDFIARSGTQLPPMPAGWTVEELFKIAYTTIGGCSSLFGLLLLILCFYVRRGGIGPAVTSLVLEGLMALLLGINVLSGIAQSGGQPVMLLGVVILLIPLALLGVNMFWLVGAARNAGQIAFVRAQYQSQYYGYQQQQQMYGQPQAYAPYPPGYPPSGYAQAPAPPLPQATWSQPPAPPPPSSSPPSSSPSSSSSSPQSFDRPPHSGGPDEPPAAAQ